LRNRLNLNRVFLVTVAHAGAGYEGRVVGVQEGDPLTLLTASKEQVKVRRGSVTGTESEISAGGLTMLTASWAFRH